MLLMGHSAIWCNRRQLAKAQLGTKIADLANSHPEAAIGAPARVCGLRAPPQTRAALERKRLARGASVGALGRIRTCDARFRKPTLYPLSYEGGIKHHRRSAPARSSGELLEVPWSGTGVVANRARAIPLTQWSGAS